MTSSSSTKRAAKLAQRGKGRKVRFQGGTVFPAAVGATLVLGVAGIAYARATLPDADASTPTIEQHWHAAYGFNLCGDWYQAVGNLEEQSPSTGQLINENFLRTGIHSHDDGVIHWHPTTSRAVGKNAVFGVFLETYEIELTDDALRFPSTAAIGPNLDFPPTGIAPVVEEYVEGETTCNGEEAELSVKAWGSYNDTDAGNRYIANMDRIHLDDDGMVFAVYFLPRDSDQVMPPWTPQLPTLGTRDVAPADVLEVDPSATTPPSSGPSAETEGSGEADSTTGA